MQRVSFHKDNVERHDGCVLPLTLMTLGEGKAALRKRLRSCSGVGEANTGLPLFWSRPDACCCIGVLGSSPAAALPRQKTGCSTELRRRSAASLIETMVCMETPLWACCSGAGRPAGDVRGARHCCISTSTLLYFSFCKRRGEQMQG